MLSSIQHVLNEICKISNVHYSQGGLIYSYSYFHNTAHSNLNNSIVNNLTEKSLDSSEIALLTILIERAINDHNAECISLKANTFSTTLSSAINESLKGYYTKIVSNECDGGGFQEITIESIDSNNTGHQLKLFWSLD